LIGVHNPPRTWSGGSSGGFSAAQLLFGVSLPCYARQTFVRVENAFGSTQGSTTLRWVLDCKRPTFSIRGMALLSGAGIKKKKEV
jgi:hypothetical protein